LALLADLHRKVYPIKGYPSAAGPVQTSKSSPVRDLSSTTEPPNQQEKVGYRETLQQIYLIDAAALSDLFEFMCCVEILLLNYLLAKRFTEL